MKKIILAACLLFNFQIYAQQPNESGFSEKVFYSGFSVDDRAHWPEVNNEFYFFLIKDSSYIVECTNSDKKAYLLPKGAPRLDTFKVEAELQPDRKKDDNGVAGIAIDIQDKISGGYLFEINSKNQFRVVTIDGNGDYSPITNRMRGEGWENLKTSKTKKSLTLWVTQLGRKISVSVDMAEVFSFDNPITTPGQNGLFISGQYKTRIRNYSVYGAGTGQMNEEKVITGQKTGDLSTMNNALLDCRKDNKDLADKLDISKQELAQARYKNKELQTYISQNLDVKLQEELKKQKEIAEKLQAENDKLKQESEDLRELKKTIEANKDGDLVMVLSENLKKEQQKNAELEKKVKALSKKKGK
jgi:hypothetical protein